VKHVGKDTTLLGKRKLEERPEDKRERVETSQQIERLLKAFEYEPRYDLKGLVHATKQSSVSVFNSNSSNRIALAERCIERVVCL